MPEFVLSHSGVKGMHWGVRRFRNYDGSLTAAGKKRYDYDEEGERSIRRAMQDQQKRERALSKLSTVNKRYPDYTEKELDTAVKKRAYRDTINAMARLETQRKLEARNERQSAKMQAKLEKAQYKAKIADEKANLKKAKMKLEQDQIRFENEEKRKQAKGERELQASIEAAKADRWKHRVTKVTSILSIAKMGKTITDQLGITDPKDGSSWFSVIGKSMGWNTTKASDVTSSSSGSSKDNKQPKDNSSPSKDNKQPQPKPSPTTPTPASEPSAKAEPKSPKNQGELPAPEPKENKERKTLKPPTVPQSGAKGVPGASWVKKEETTPKPNQNGSASASEKTNWEQTTLDSGLKVKVPKSIERIGKENARYIRETPLAEIIDKRGKRENQLFGGKTALHDFIRSGQEVSLDSVKDFVPFWWMNK